MANELERVAPPVIPYAQPEYDAVTQVQTNSILRLFFNRLLSQIDALLSKEDGGKALYFPRALVYSTTTQTAAEVDTGYALELENTYIDNGVRIENDTQMHVSADGVYNFQVTMQFTQTNSSAAQVYTWISKNGVDVPYGGQATTLTGSNNQSIHWNFSIDLLADGYITMYWATSDTAVSLTSVAPTAPHPGIPSAVVAVTYVSNY